MEIIKNCALLIIVVLIAKSTGQNECNGVLTFQADGDNELDTDVTAFCIECANPSTGTADTDILWIVDGATGSISFSDTPPPAEIAVTSTGLLFVADSSSIVPLGGALQISSCFGALYSNYDIVVISSAFAPPTANPSELTIIEGESGRVLCEDSNFRRVSEAWTFNGMPPRATNRQILNLNDITRDDAGTYRCQLSFDGAEIEGAFVDFELTVHYAPEAATTEVAYREISLGANLALTCHFDGAPTPSVTWLLNNTEVANTDDITTENGVTTLVIHDISRSDSGVYSCKFNNSVNTVQINTTVLDIDECASDADNCDTNAVCTNTPGGFTCACSLGYSGNGQTCVDIDECAADICDMNAVCTNTPGSFTCTCNEGYRGDGFSCQGARFPTSVLVTSITSSSATIQWMLTEPYIPSLPETFTVSYGTSSGQLNFNTREKTASPTSQTYSTQLNSLQPGIVHFYRIRSQNDFGTIFTEEMTFLTNEERSSEVTNLQVESTSDTTFIITWEPPATPNGNILSYSISIINLTDGSAVRQENIETTTITQTELEAGVPYNVSIAAVNREGPGEFSVFIHFTRELAPSIAPMDVSIDRTSPTVMVVSWTPLSYVEARGFISHYTLAYSPQTSDGRKRQALDTMFQTVPGMDSSITRIEGLDPDTGYTVQVSATTGAGRNEFSPAIYITPPFEECSGNGVVTGLVVGIVVVVIATLIVITALTMILIRKKTPTPSQLSELDMSTYDVVQEKTPTPSQQSEVDMCTYDVVGGGHEVVKKQKQITCTEEPHNTGGESIKLSQCPAYRPVTEVGGANVASTSIV